jgi:hypothetical protein
LENEGEDFHARLGIDTAFAFDDDFRQFGIVSGVPGP